MLVVITPPKASIYEAKVANALFDYGLQRLHLRLPDGKREEYIRFLESVHPPYHHRIVICDHYDLLDQFNLAGIYIPASKKTYRIPEGLLSPLHIVSTGIHSLEDLKTLSFTPDYVLLSPVFDSISKAGYQSNPKLSELREEIKRVPFPILALGGISSENAFECYRRGFDGVAILGNIWDKRGLELQKFRLFSDPIMFSVAGHDPSGGAGIVADTRVAEACGVRCVSIPSTLTVQNVSEFHSYEEVQLELILENMRLSAKGNNIRAAKIGMMSSLGLVKTVIDEMLRLGIKQIVWDPIKSTTAGDCVVLQTDDKSRILDVMRSLSLITPNIPECEAWFGSCDEETLQAIADKTDCSILLKGGHSQERDISKDMLFRPRLRLQTFSVSRYGTAKHGTGCIFSSAVTAYLALGDSLPIACCKAQRMVSKMMCSKTGLLPSLDAFEDKKSKKLQHYRFQYITNTSDPEELYHRCKEALVGGCRWVQLRLKESTTDERTIIGKMLRKLCDEYTAVLIIDDDVEAALRCAADGVHLGRDDMSPVKARRILGRGSIIGSTCNTSVDILKAYHTGSDYIGVGPYRTTNTKKKLSPVLGAEGLSDLVAYNHTLPHPMLMVAIGGLRLSDVHDLKDIGFLGMAVSGEIDRSPSIRDLCQQFVDALE
ncbi:thiamine phosphate synthase [Porphyromonas sp.]|uniref:thiamine phosphate synthase n=1 Tax=Porphyromonas sp. TaxID=1924944 RepID=UPI0026DCCB50|nr:thiamine phosphate synthase [Porphyromonas sp.]MDO4695299.1 thiamine phosphate synthase [Porphyromonas sp.]MDO4771038.1 thiamine phosphate synthase [Porphyromonas sp.]